MEYPSCCIWVGGPLWAYGIPKLLHLGQYALTYFGLEIRTGPNFPKNARNLTRVVTANPMYIDILWNGSFIPHTDVGETIFRTTIIPTHYIAKENLNGPKVVRRMLFWIDVYSLSS